MNVNSKVVILLFESLKNKDVRTFLQQTLTKDCYKSIEPPESLKNNYYLEKNFAFFRYFIFGIALCANAADRFRGFFSGTGFGVFRNL